MNVTSTALRCFRRPQNVQRYRSNIQTILRLSVLHGSSRFYSTQPFDPTEQPPPSQSSSDSQSQSSHSSDSSAKAKLPRKPKKTTILDIQRKWQKSEPISMLTAHDYASAHYIEQSNSIDVALVGDSLAMVVCGYDSTSRLGLDEMLYHCRAVARGAKTPLLISDMPYGTYQGSIDSSVENAIRLVREGFVDAVKVEGGHEIVPLVRRLTEVGVPVMAHVGLQPQKLSSQSGFRVQGKTAESARKTHDEAVALADAGAFAIVLEAIPAPIATHITSNIPIPTIGIGAGPGCSGQVLVTLDMLGGFDRFHPKFVKSYLNLSQLATQAINQYSEDVKSRSFPDDPANTYPIPEEELQSYLDTFKENK